MTSDTIHRAGLPVIDCDVHPSLRNGVGDLLDYMGPSWRQRLGARDLSYAKIPSPRYNNPNSTLRVDATPPGGGLPGSDPEFVRDLSEFPDGSCRIIDVDGRSIGVFNVGGRIHAVLNVCPHRYAPICQGVVTGTMLPSSPGELTYGLAGR